MKPTSYGMSWRLVVVGLMLCSGIWLFSSCNNNSYPVINSLQSQTTVVAPSSSCEVTCIADDTDGDELNYAWSADGGKISGEGNTITWTAPDTSGTYSVAVTVSDGNDGEATKQLCMAVQADRPPVIDRISVEPSAVGQGLRGTIKCFAVDPEGGKLSYNWKASGGTIVGKGASADWTAPDEPGNCTITVEVMDSSGSRVSLATAVDVLRNNEPIIKSLKANPSSIATGKASTIECIAYDPDGDELNYQWQTSAGNITDEGPTVNWTAPADCSTCTITVTVDDGRGAEATKKVVVRVRAPGG